MPREEKTSQDSKKYQDIVKNKAEGEATSKTINSSGTLLNSGNKGNNLTLLPRIPNLSASSPMLGIRYEDNFEFESAIPKFKNEGKRPFPVNLITNSPANIKTRNIVFHEDIINIKNNLLVSFQPPDLNIIYPPNVKLLITDYDSSLLKIVDNSNGGTGVLVPSLNTIHISSLIEKEILFNSSTVAEIKVAKNKVSQPQNESNYGGDSDLELPWGKDVHYKLFFTGSNSSKSLKIIIVPDKDEYAEFVAMNCRDKYRVDVGGYPEIERVDNINKMEEMFQQVAEHKLVIVKSFDPTDKNQIDYLLKKIIENKPYQGEGFIILVTKDIDKFVTGVTGTSDDIIIIKESDFKPLINKAELFLNAVSGFKSNSLISPSEFGTNFKNNVETFDKSFEKFVNIDYLKIKLNNNRNAFNYLLFNKHLLIRTRDNKPEEASDIHSGMKGFIFVSESLNSDEQVELESSPEFSDVSVGGKKFYEAETFFGRGDPHALLTEKMEKYKYSNGEVIFTMRNIDIIRNIYAFKEYLAIHNRSGHQTPRVEICGFDFKNEKLLPMSKIIEIMG